MGQLEICNCRVLNESQLADFWSAIAMPTRVKICGVTRLEDALLAVELGAAALGFNFYPPSPRYLEPRAAAEIIRHMPPLVTAVGVFADETDDLHIAAVAREASVSAVQLHGPGFPASFRALEGLRLIRAVAVREDFKPEDLAA